MRYGAQVENKDKENLTIEVCSTLCIMEASRSKTKLLETCKLRRSRRVARQKTDCD